MKQQRQGWLALMLLLALTGCRSSGPTPYEQWTARQQRIIDQPNPTGTKTYELLSKAAEDAERDAKELAAITAFTPKQQKLLKDRIKAEVDLVRQHAGEPIDFPEQSKTPFAPLPHQAGWRLIGNCLVWTVQAAVSGKDYDKAINNALVATRFGFHLTSGNPTDASLGLALVDEAREALADGLPSMSAAQLEKLASGIEGALLEKPTLVTCLKRERNNTLQSIQTVQDAYSQNQLKELRSKLGPAAGDAIAHLDTMREGNDGKRPQYFEGFAAEGMREADFVEKACLLPAVKRKALEPELGPKKKRPWAEFSEVFFRGGRALIAINDITLARTRLLALSARMELAAKKTQEVPSSLKGFQAKLIQDPFSGRPFIYRGEGQWYRVYSVGSDLKDDGGETDPESFKTPDLRLEFATR